MMALNKRFLWFGLPLVCWIVFFSWPRGKDESTEHDRTPPPAPAPDAQPVLRSAGPLPGERNGMKAKPVVAADRDRRVSIIAMEASANDWRLVQWRSTDGGQRWDEPTPLPSWPKGCDQIFDPWLQTDYRGRFHFVHVSVDLARKMAPTVYRRSLDGGSTWQAPTRVAERSDRPVVAVSPGGKIVAIACMIGDPNVKVTADILTNPNRFFLAGIFRSDDRGETWTRLPSPADVRHAVPFSIVVDDAGRIACGWIANDGRGSQSVVCITCDKGTTWSRTVLVEALQPDRKHPFNGGRFPVLALDGAGRPHLVYVEAGGKALSARTCRDWDVWSDRVQLSSAGAAEVRFPAVAAAGEVIHAIWMERLGKHYCMWYRGSRDGGATWSAPLALSRPQADSRLVGEEGFYIVSDDDQPCVSDDGCGTAHAVWAVRGGKPRAAYEVWHAAINWRPPGQ